MAESPGNSPPAPETPATPSNETSPSAGSSPPTQPSPSPPSPDAAPPPTPPSSPPPAPPSQETSPPPTTSSPSPPSPPAETKPPPQTPENPSPPAPVNPTPGTPPAPPQTPSNQAPPSQKPSPTSPGASNERNRTNGGNGNNGGDTFPLPPSGNRNSSDTFPLPPRSISPPRNSGGSDSSFPPGDNQQQQANIGLIIGVLAGAGLLLLLLVIICICCNKKKKKKKQQVNHMHYYNNNNNNNPFGGHTGGNGGYNNYNNGTSQDHVVNMASQGGGSWGQQQPVSGPHSDSSNGPGPSPQGATLGHNQSTFTYDELSIATEGFSQSNLLGQGGFGYVHKGVLPSGKEVAVKSLKLGSGQGEREFQAEVEIISRVHHRHLVSLVGYCISGAQRLLVYEFLPNNTLEFHLHGKGRPVMEWSIRVKIALGSARGLAYLHEDCHPKIIHRDIKAANILLDYSFETQVADFGLAKLSQDNYTHVSTRIMGTFGYLAPEYASSGKLSDKSDVFSFGVMLLELITGRPPIDLTGEMEDSLVDWARPLCLKGAQDGDYSQLADPRLEGVYDQQEMARMASCAAAAIRHSARRRPKMSQIVRALETDVSMEDLSEGGRPGQNSYLSPGSGVSSEYDASSYSADMKKFRKLALESKEYQSSDYGATSEYGLNPSASSSEEMTRGSMKRNPQL
ncbi:unnamed protein product [Microthlaspi erraticum]|uniref:non-specific serine/threonine protein kinase n=1 Tax=Microthlaspi erraticum TaxID=1685480 RepID=A0A6D2I3D8_9BRAS|nr:unnamed protein product [Microthlaspi erraticum]